MHTPINRRTFFKVAAGVAATGAAGILAAPKATALDLPPGPILGTVIDYAAGVPSAASIKAAGHLGAVRYVSQRRPGTETWMLGKPVTLAETRSFATLGLKTASVYQYGKAGNADWLNGAAGAAVHAPQAIALHVAAGGPTNRPIYVAIDDNPTWTQYLNQIRPYLQAFKTALGAAGYSLGVYGNYNVIDWAINDGLGEFFWMHNWGSNGRIHPRTTLHQVRIDQDVLDGVGIDINHVYAHDWGQWTPHVTAPPIPPAPPAPSAPAPNVSADQLTQWLNLLGRASSL